MPLAYDVVSAARSNTALSYGVTVTPQPYKFISLYAGDSTGNNIIIQKNFVYVTSLSVNPFGNQTKQDTIVENEFVYSNTKSLVVDPFGNQTKQDTIIENKFGYSNTEPMVYNTFQNQTKPDSIQQPGFNQTRIAAPVQVLNTSLSTVTGAGGAESWIS